VDLHRYLFRDQVWVTDALKPIFFWYYHFKSIIGPIGRLVRALNTVLGELEDMSLPQFGKDLTVHKKEG